MQLCYELSHMVCSALQAEVKGLCMTCGGLPRGSPLYAKIRFFGENAKCGPERGLFDVAE